MEIKESFISVDVETTGAVPGLYSMIDLGAVSVSDISDTFSASLVELPNGAWSVETRQFWMKNDHNRRILTEIQEKARPIADVMHDFRSWLSNWKKPILIGFPATFDFAWINYYWWLVFRCEPPFGWGGLDIKTLGMITMRSGFRESTKRILKKKLPPGKWQKMQHTHRGVDDAGEQAELFKLLMEIL